MVQLALLLAVAAGTGVAPRLAVSGDLPKPVSFSLDDLERLHPVTATWKAHDGVHQVHGVALDQILAAAGFEPGPMGRGVSKREKRAGWKKVLRVTAADGYQAIFSCAELWATMGPTRALLVWKMDGAPLPERMGPFRVVVLTDQEPSRSIFQVTKLELLDLRS